MDYRFLSREEALYTFPQIHQIAVQTGMIGNLRIDFGPIGEGFYAPWQMFKEELNAHDFKEETDALIADCTDFLKDRKILTAFFNEHPESAFKDDSHYFGMRTDTEKYAYLFRFDPQRKEGDLCAYAYEKAWLDRHIERAKQGIRFIDSAYKERFRIQDGEKITIRFSDGQKMDRVCRYIDDYHTAIGDQLFHICEFAEICERNGHLVEPAAREKTSPTKNKGRSR